MFMKELYINVLNEMFLIDKEADQIYQMVNI